MPLAIITGARPGGIALGIAAALEADGWDIALSDLDGVEFPADLSRADAAGALFEAVKASRGTVSALVLAQAYDVESGILDTSVESWDRHFAINARASWQLIAEFARQVPESGGSIVALTSDATTGNLPYGASKGALDRIAISAARELAPLGITSNAVNPGPVDTGWMTDEVRAVLTDRQPSGRLGTPTDVADLIAFLVSPRGRWVTGQLLHADGGFAAPF